MPLPTSTPGKGSIFATRISSSRTEPSLAAAAISPYARRQQAYREERALRRDIINSRGGLGEHLRTTQSQHNYPPPEATEDIDSPDETAETRAEEEQASTFSGEEDDTQPKPSGRRTRQRTRELSVMSDTSVDDAAASLRRSTRIRKKPQDTEHQSPQRVRKSAKSPPPVATKDTSRKSKARKNPVANEGQNDAEMDEDRTSKPASPGRGRSPDAESAPNKRFATTPQKNMSIDQVLAEGPPTHEGSKEKATIPQPSAREQRLSTTVARRTRGFSAKDDVDEMVETSSSTTEQPKLKLPNSVFANRFSFGRSPSSSLLASPSRTTFEEKASSQTKATETAESQSSATTLPKLALPSSAMLSGTGSSTVAGGSSPSVSFAGASQRSPAPPTAMPQASALKATPSQEGPTPASKPLFSFTAPANDTAKVSQSLFQAPAKEGQSVVSNSQTSFFDAGASSTHTSAGTPDDTTGGVTAPFAFASSSNKEKVSHTIMPLGPSDFANPCLCCLLVYGCCTCIYVRQTCYRANYPRDNPNYRSFEALQSICKLPFPERCAKRSHQGGNSCCHGAGFLLRRATKDRVRRYYQTDYGRHSWHLRTEQSSVVRACIQLWGYACKWCFCFWKQ